MQKINCKVIIQARISSTRLPEKTILDFHQGKGILEILIQRIKNVIPEENIVVATSTNTENDMIVDIAKKNNVYYIRGSEDDVLDRFKKAAEEFDIQNIIRVCSDNVFLDLSELRKLYEIGTQNNHFDYIAYDINNTPNILTHYGLWCELISNNAISYTHQHTQNKEYREHVTNFIYNHPKIFKIKWLIPQIIPSSKKIRLTTDTQTDFEVQKYIFELVFKQNSYNFTTQDVLDLLDRDPKFKTIMESQIMQNEK